MSGLAVASLILALASVLLCGFGLFTSIAAVIVGLFAKRRIATTGQSGTHIATTGIILGALIACVAITVLVISAITGDWSHYFIYR